MFICPSSSDLPTEIGWIDLKTINQYLYQIYIKFCNINYYYPKKHKRHVLSLTVLNITYDILWRSRFFQK